MAVFAHRRLLVVEEENIEPRQEENIQQREFRPRINPLTLYTNRQFKKRYRLPKHSILTLARALKARGFKGPLHGRPFQRTISAVLTVCVGVRFFATGSMYRDIGDAHHIGQSSVCRCVRKTLNLLIALMERHMAFPLTRRQMQRNSDDFFDIAQLPGVIGAVDGTHVCIKPPSEEERSFRNRKGTYSINVQVMCDANLVFMDVDAQWPGSCHDSSIWRKSEVGKMLQQFNFIHPFYIIGDSGYPLRPWLLTPYLNPATQTQRDYNRALASTRNTVERAIGLLKIRFRCLDKTGGVIQSPPGTASEIISCCMILHNIAIRAGIPMEINEEDDEDGNANDQVRRIMRGEDIVFPQVDIQNQQGDAADRQRNREGQRFRNGVANANF